ncbi:MAG: hypothetical protein AABY86_16685, partial [Bdellovibrionota bacterium]
MLNKIKKFHLLLGMLFLWLILMLIINPYMVDDDGYFHFRFSELTWNQGLITALPQRDNLSWATNFVDSHFFFHVLTTFGWGLGGEWGIKSLIVMLGLIMMYMIYQVATARSEKGQTGLILILLSMLNLYFIDRVLMVRPHVVSQLFYFINLYALVKNKRAWVFLSAALHALSYHAYYLIILNLCIGLGLQKKIDFKTFAWGSVCLAIGIL